MPAWSESHESLLPGLRCRLLAVFSHGRKKQSENKLSALLLMPRFICLLDCTGPELQHDRSSVFVEACGISVVSHGI